jgi:hypothetical protein
MYREILDDLSLFVGQNEQSNDIMIPALSFHGREPQGCEMMPDVNRF